jgi:putative peptidoglycan lipid II flippase
MWAKIFKQRADTIAGAAILVAMSSLVSRFLGIFRDHILASRFNAGANLDIYYAAFRIPDLLYNLIVLGALSAGFIPIFTGLVKNFNDPKSPEENSSAWKLASNVVNLLLILLIVLSAAGIVLAPQIIHLLTPGFSGVEQEQTVRLTRIMFLSPIFLGISGVLGGILQSFRRFFVYSLSPIFYNLGIIAGAIFLAPRFGLIGLAFGVVAGAFLHMAVQLPAVFSLGFKHFWKIDWCDSNTWRIARLMVPRTMSLAISQIDLMVTTIIASGLAAGSLAVFNLANNLQSFPIGIFGVSFAVAAFPVLSNYAFNKEKLVENFSETMRRILFFVIPATVFIITLRAQIIRVVLGAGVFSWNSTILTMNTLALFSLSLFAQASIPLLVRVFYARHDSRTPFYLGLFTVGTDIVLCLFFSARLGVAGLALAYSFSNILNFLLLWIRLHFTVGDLDIDRIVVSSFKFTVGAVAAGLAIQIMKVVIWPFIDMTTFFGVLMQLSASALAGVIIYALFCWLLGSEEFFSLLRSVRRRLPFKTFKSDDQGEARGV